MKVGDKVVCDIVRASYKSSSRMETIRETGTVVYIHPKRRFYRVRFDFPGGSWHESFLMEGGIA